MRPITILTAVLTITACGKNSDSPSDSKPAANSSSGIPDYKYPVTFSDPKMTFCQNGTCHTGIIPSACSSLPIFNDFTIYSETLATFYGSIKESVSIDFQFGAVMMNSDTTGHNGVKFDFAYLKSYDLWQITYGPNCVRLYKALQ